jgi:hypothetical protein
MKPLLPVFLLACFAVAANGQIALPTLVDKFALVPCSDLRNRLDSLMFELADDPSMTGIIALSDDAPYLDVFRRRRLIENQIIFRNFDRSRIVFVRRHGLAKFDTELWKAAPHSNLPFEYDSSWPYTLERSVKPFVLIADGFDESECAPPAHAEFVSGFLKANPNSRINIVIKSERQVFRALQRYFANDLTGRYGISRNRFQFYYVPLKSMLFSYEIWILN